MIQFNIQFKIKSKIFIQKIIHSIESKIFNKIIHSTKLKNIIQNSNLIMWFSNLKWQPIEEWNIQNNKQTKTT